MPGKAFLEEEVVMEYVKNGFPGTSGWFQFESDWNPFLMLMLGSIRI